MSTSNNQKEIKKDYYEICYTLLKTMYDTIAEKGKIKTIDGNHFHFMMYELLEKEPELKKNIPCGWFVHGPYVPWVDDLLVERLGMEKKYHQTKGEEPYCSEMIETTYYKEE